MSTNVAKINNGRSTYVSILCAEALNEFIWVLTRYFLHQNDVELALNIAGFDLYAYFPPDGFRHLREIFGVFRM